MTKEEAIDILKQAAWLGTDGFIKQTEEAVEMAIQALSQPEKRTKERTETHVCDYIERQAAIDAIEEYADRLQMVNWKENSGVLYKAYALNWCINTIRDLPSAQPERKTGHWIHDGSKWAERWICDQCSYKLIGAKTDYCGGCGCKMEVEHDTDR